MVKVLYPTIRLRFIFFVRSPRLTSNLDQFLTKKTVRREPRAWPINSLETRKCGGTRIIFTIPDFFFSAFCGGCDLYSICWSVDIDIGLVFFGFKSLALQIINLDSINQLSMMVFVPAICIPPEFCISGP